MELPYDPAIPLRIYSKNPEIPVRKNTSTPMFTAALFTIAKIWQQSKYPSADEWIKQLWNLYTMECYSAGKRRKSYHFATAWLDLENIMLSQISQSEKDKYHMISLIWNLTNKIN